MRAQTLEIRIEIPIRPRNGRTSHLTAFAFRKKNSLSSAFLSRNSSVASKVKCPLHGERFKLERTFGERVRWLREKAMESPVTFGAVDSEQYRKAWFAKELSAEIVARRRNRGGGKNGIAAEGWDSSSRLVIDTGGVMSKHCRAKTKAGKPCKSQPCKEQDLWRISRGPEEGC